MKKTPEQRLCEQQVQRFKGLVKAAENNLKAATKAKAPKGELKFIGKRVEILKKSLKAWEKKLEIAKADAAKKAKNEAPCDGEEADAVLGEEADEKKGK